MRACFAAGTPIKIEGGSKPVEQIRPGVDRVLSRNEFDLEGPLAYKEVEEVFVRTAPVLNLHVGGRIIGTTAEHPFWVEGRGWTKAIELRIGDVLHSDDGQRITVEGVADSGRVQTVYNFRVAEYHTYFVGCEAWGFSVWAHNMCEFDVTRYGNFRKASGDKLAGHEMLQNAWLRAKGLATGRSGSLVAGNPAMALGDAIHSAVGTQQSLLGLFNGPATMNGMSALKNIALNAKAMFRTGQIPRESIVDQLRQAIAYGKNIGVI